MISEPVNLGKLADDVVRAILRTQYEGLAALRIDSPPGAGKTGLVERLAVQGMAVMNERVMVATQTNEQAFDLARRLSLGFQRQNFALYVRRDLEVPSDLARHSNLALIRSPQAFPDGPCVVVANAARWSWLDDTSVAPFDLQIIDEAFQLPDHRFHQIAGMADRLIQIGDPGQIAPVVSIEIERWRCDPAGPHVPSPKALVTRHPDVPRMSLPISRRLVPDTVQFIQPAFYPDLPFQALSLPGERGIKIGRSGSTPIDRPINLAEQGASLIHIELSPKITSEVDAEMTDTITTLIHRLIQRRVKVFIGDTQSQLVPSMIGVVCTHISQVNAIRERLPQTLEDVFVETADRFQGLERPVMLAYHPLSGKADPDQFHLDAGRICVMLSRHSVLGFLIARGGIEQRLDRYTPGGDRALGAEADFEFDGWRAHLNLLYDLRYNDRLIQLF